MTVSIQDVVAGKMLVQLGWRRADAVRGDLEVLDRTAGAHDLVGYYGAHRVLDVTKVEKLRRYVDLYERVRREALYVGLLERGQILQQDEIDQWKARIEGERYTRRLGDLLMASGRIAPERDAELRHHQSLGIERENVRLLEHYRKARFEGVARPITKNSRTPIDTGTFTIRNLFRSAESQRLARLAPPPTDPGAEARRQAESAPTIDETKSSPTFTRTTRIPSLEEVTSARRPPSHHPPSLPEGVPETIGPYVVEGVLGKGGMGIVLKARRNDQTEQVALKLGLSKEDEFRARLRREILATSMLHHENVIQVLDAGEADDGSPYLVMELVKGRELRDYMKDRGSFEVRDALAIFVQILGAVGAAHQAGIIHRDMKPENVLVTESQGDFVAKVMDFGLAKILEIDPEHADRVFTTLATNVVSGSPRYISPEQVIGDAVDARTDLYSCGIVLFELLTGQLPYAGSTAGEFIRAHVQKPPRRLAVVKPDGSFPEPLEALVASLLEKVPAKRPADAAAVIEAIERTVLPAIGLRAVPASSPGTPPPPIDASRPGAAIDDAHQPRGITRVLGRLWKKGDTRPPV